MTLIVLFTCRRQDFRRFLFPDDYTINLSVAGFWVDQIPPAEGRQ
jgi:hypothetical protein